MEDKDILDTKEPGKEISTLLPTDEEDILEAALPDILDLEEEEIVGEEEEEEEEWLKICGDCLHFGGLYQNPKMGLCRRKSMKSEKSDKVVWKKAEDDAEKCKFWCSELDEYWGLFWNTIEQYMDIDTLKRLIEDLGKALVEKQQPDTIELDEDLETTENWLDEGKDT